MPRFAANLSLLYAHLPFLERIKAAKADGFKAIECQFPYQENSGATLNEITQLMKQLDLNIRHSIQQQLNTLFD
jgi:hydroxypyruvate isomerase